MTLPLYKSVAKNPPKRGDNGHAGLWFDKFCNQWLVKDTTWSMSSQGSDEDGPKLKWINTLAGTSVGVHDQIEECAFRIVRLVESRGGICAVFTTESRFVTGLGRSHPVENGFAWHSTLGTPYLPGSSVKGMVRAWAEQETHPRPDSEDLDRLLGERNSAGRVCFLDALPIQPVKLEADVMTPHYAGWSEKDDPPGDWRSPTPIPFLTTATGTSFLFGIIPLRHASAQDMVLVESWIQDALEWAGAGAKTAIGYGRLARDEARAHDLRERLGEVDRQREERIRQEMEAKAREERLASLSPVQQQIEVALDNRQDRNMPETTAIYQVIESGRWSGDEKLEAARWLEDRMKAGGTWKPTTKARRPERDREHRRTLQILRWLDGE